MSAERPKRLKIPPPEFVPGQGFQNTAVQRGTLHDSSFVLT